jgi:FKBP-type peptidyl-prolyl cis-trans isomerase 2
MIEPGMRVMLPTRPDWGEGQVQSVVGDRVTVNFEHGGKRLINNRLATLEIVAGPAR